MMETANTQKPASGTFVVIDGGLNFKPAQASNDSEAKVIGASQAGDSDTTLQLHDGESICRLDQEIYFLSQ